MACVKRSKTGRCSHHQCPYPQETEHGYECVGIVRVTIAVERDVCEVGDNCLEKCALSFKSVTIIPIKGEKQ